MQRSDLALVFKNEATKVTTELQSEYYKSKKYKPKLKSNLTQRTPHMTHVLMQLNSSGKISLTHPKMLGKK